MDKVSVIIPYYNDGERIGRCLDSVINQTCSPIEIIIIDDNSSDSDKLLSAIELRRKKLKNISLICLKNNENRNGAYSRNKGIAHSKGNFIGLLDADDYWLDCHIEKSLDALKHDNSVFVYSNLLYEKNNKKTKRKVNDINNLKNKFDILLMSPPQTNSFFFRKELFKKVKFDENLKRHQDFQFLFDIILSNEKISYLNLETTVYVESQKTLKTRVDFDSMLSFWDKRRDYFNQNKLMRKMVEIFSDIIKYESDNIKQYKKKYTCLAMLENKRRILFNGKINLKYRYILCRFLVLDKNFLFKLKKRM